MVLTTMSSRLHSLYLESAMTTAVAALEREASGPAQSASTPNCLCVDDGGLTQLDSVLSGDMFKELQVVELRVTFTVPELTQTTQGEKIRESIQHQLPQLCARKEPVLRVVS